jgi:hypothetical protein
VAALWTGNSLGAGHWTGHAYWTGLDFGRWSNLNNIKFFIFSSAMLIAGSLQNIIVTLYSDMI